MTRLDIDAGGQSRSAVRHGFWRRQFMPATTRAQRIFDVLLGVVAPVLCFAFDPIVFKDNFGVAGGLFPEYQSYAYMVSGVEILLLLIWLVYGRQLSPRTLLLGGMLVAGALFSGLIGLIILPFTLLGLFVFGIGIFGFIPFLTGLVYLRNGRSAFELANNHRAGSVWIGAVVVGGVVVLGTPASVNFIASRFVSESMNAVLYASPQSADMAVDQIKYLRFFARPEVDRLVSAYATEDEPSRKEELKRRYLRLTGEDIDVRLRILTD
jgi:hypothetical protein